MSTSVKEKRVIMKELMNASIESVKNVVPIQQKVISLEQFESGLQLQMGVLIGITGDAKGQLVLSGDEKVFSSIGEAMFGMPLEGEMLSSFSGELGNMIAGGMSTNVTEKGIQTDITSPTIMQGDTTLTGYTHALKLSLGLENIGQLDLNLLIN